AALGRVPPLRVLRRDMLPIPPSSWLVYGAALIALGLIMWRLSLDLKLTLALLGGGLLATVLLGGLLLGTLQGMRRLLANASLSWRLGIGQLLRHPLAAAGQSLAFGLILLAMALIALLRGELLDTWQDQLPADAPNHFVLNVLPADKDAFNERVLALSSSSVPLYPVVPGRLVAINGEPVRQLVSKESQGERAIRRDLSLTWAEDLPPDNHLTAGRWWQPGAANELAGVSVEAELAESLQVALGDRLSFTVGGLTRDVTVTSLREVNWDSFQPNFYMIFEPGTLQDMPTTYMTSFHLPAGRDRELVQLARDFPSATLLQVEALLGQLRSILAQVSLAVEYVLLFVLAAGLAVLFAGLQATLDERIRQGALLRALGAKRALLLKARRTEFGLLGACSGLLAALGCELVSTLLYHFVFDLRWQPHPWLLLLPLIGALLVGGAGVLGTRRALNASPLNVLREN
nr:ABC transporter permease [Pseudomonas sp.]